jgi:hypothetical protein
MSTTRKRKQQEAAGPAPAPAPPPATGYILICSRQSTLLETDEECFVDAAFESDIEAQCEESAKAWDGSWVWDHKPNKVACAPYNQPRASVAGGSGRPRVFSTAAAAEEAAVQVWTAMLQATKQPCTPVLQQLSQQKKAAGSSKAAKKKSSSSQQLDSSLAAAAAQLRSVTADGLPCWTADISWFDDPFDVSDEPVQNEVCTTIKVEVVRAELV